MRVRSPPLPHFYYTQNVTLAKRANVLNIIKVLVVQYLLVVKKKKISWKSVYKATYESMRQAAKRRANGRCEWLQCTRTDPVMQADHIKSRKHWILHLDINNIIWLHQSCHIYRKKSDPIGWADSVVAARGRGTVEWLKLESKKVGKKPSVPELLVIKSRLDKMFI